jgi:ribosome-binding factor A
MIFVGVVIMSRLRVQRVQEELKKEIGQMLQREIKDPRIGFVTVTDVEVSKDLRNVKIFVSVYGSDQERSDTMAGLESARGYIRTEIGKRIKLRYTPEISFRFDESIARGARIMELLNEVKEQDGEGRNE